MRCGRCRICHGDGGFAQRLSGRGRGRSGLKRSRGDRGGSQAEGAGADVICCGQSQGQASVCRRSFGISAFGAAFLTLTTLTASLAATASLATASAATATVFARVSGITAFGGFGALSGLGFSAGIAAFALGATATATASTAAAAAFACFGLGFFAASVAALSHHALRQVGVQRLVHALGTSLTGATAAAASVTTALTAAVTATFAVGLAACIGSCTTGHFHASAFVTGGAAATASAFFAGFTFGQGALVALATWAIA